MRNTAELSLRDLMTDPIIRSVMKADKVDPRALEAMLVSMARTTRPARAIFDVSRVPPASVALCGTPCAW